MLKIKLAIIDTDKIYSDRLCVALNAKYENKLEIYVFNTVESAAKGLNNVKADVVLADRDTGFDNFSILENASFAYLCASDDISTINGKKAICKYQKIDTFYKNILSLYADKIDDSIEINPSSERKNIILFLSAAGGTGASSLALAYALRLAKHGIKPLLLNLEMFSDTSVILKGDGTQTLSDVIYAVKSKKSNLSIKIQSALKTTASGICYFDSCNLPLDLMETSADDYDMLLDVLSRTDGFDEIIIDTDFSLSEKDMLLMKKAHKIIAVSDGSGNANAKTKKMLDSVNIIDEQSHTAFSKKIRIFYNRFSNKNANQINNVEFVGGAPRFEGFSYSQIINKISELSDLDKI